MEIKLTVSKESFTGEDGKVVEYTAYKAIMDGEEVRFFPRKEDKRLVEHFIKRAVEAGKVVL